MNSFSSTVATEVSELPIATAVSGSGISFSKALGVFTATSDSLGTILTQRGETIGRHQFFLSFSYQHFSFDSLDGVNLKDFPTLNVVPYSALTSYTQAKSDVKLDIDQFTFLGTFGLTRRIDATFILPLSKITLNTVSSTQQFNWPAPSSNPTGFVGANNYSLPGSATGIGDVGVNVKGSVFRGERSSLALGGEVRFPTGDASSYLGSGAYGLRPYVVVSRRGRITPNVNLGYQWSGRSVLNLDPVTGAHLRLPSSFLYSAGVDVRVVRRFTLVGEFQGQYVFNGPQLLVSNYQIPGQSPSKEVWGTGSNSYPMNNLGPGFKLNPFKHFFVDASVMFKTNEAGLRAKEALLIGASYRF